MKKTTSILLTVLLLISLFAVPASASDHTHTWVLPDCVTPPYCVVCGMTTGRAMGHSWEFDSTTGRYVCSVCGAAGDAGSVQAAQSIPESRPVPVAVDGGENHTVVLYSDGTVRAVGDNTYGQCNVSGWRDIVQICTAFNHTVGLKSDGTVIATGNNADGQCNVSTWNNICKVAVGESHTIGLRGDGTVVAVGSNRNNQLNVGAWSDIRDIAATKTNSVGVTSGGRLIIRGDFTNTENTYIGGIYNASYVYAGTGYFIGVDGNGSVSGYGRNTLPDGSGNYENISVKDWSDIVQVAVGRCNAFGLTGGGQVYVSGRNDYNQINAVSGWQNVKAIGAGLNHVVAILDDGNLVAAGDTSFGKCDFTPLASKAGNEVSLRDLPYTSKIGKLWTRGEVAPMGIYDTKQMAPGCWNDSSVPGYTQGPAYDNVGNRYAFGMHLDGGDTADYSITYALNGMYSTFSGTRAYPQDVISDTWAPVYQKSFRVYADGRLLYTATLGGAYTPPEYFRVDVTGAQTLTILWPATDGPNEAATLYDPILTK